MLEELWEHFARLGSSPRLVAISGNHDLIRPDPRIAAVKALKLWHQDDDIRNEFWTNPTSEYRSVIKDAFANFISWWQQVQVPKVEGNLGLLPGDVAVTLESHGVKCGVIGLNTAFLQLTGEDYETRLDVSERQIHVMCDGDAGRWSELNDFNFLLTHHPIEWLHSEALRTGFAGRLLHLADSWFIFAGTFMRRCLSQSVREVLRYAGFWQGRSLFGLKAYVKGERGFEQGHLVFQFNPDERQRL